MKTRSNSAYTRPIGPTTSDFLVFKDYTSSSAPSPMTSSEVKRYGQESARIAEPCAKKGRQE